MRWNQLPEPVGTSYRVTIDIVTAQLSLAALTARLGIEPDESSRDRGSRRLRYPGRAGGEEHPAVWETTCWVLASGKPSASLAEHVADVLSRVPLAELRRLEVLPDDAEVTLDIAIFHESITCSIDVPPEVLARLAELKMDLWISCYPCAESDPPEGERGSGAEQGPGDGGRGGG